MDDRVYKDLAWIIENNNKEKKLKTWKNTREHGVKYYMDGKYHEH